VLVWSRAVLSEAEAIHEESRLSGLRRKESEAMLTWPCPTRSLTLANPLLTLFHRAYPPPPEGVSVSEAEEWAQESRMDETFHGMTREAASRHAWGIPTERAIRMIASTGSIVEMGAGNGYWSRLLRMAGSDVIAFDERPTWSVLRTLSDKNPWMAMGSVWGRVKRGTPKDLTGKAERTLLLCWPPKDDPMAAESLRVWNGVTLAVVGPRRYVASDEFYDMLQADYHLLHDEPLPSWPECEDSVQIWSRL